MSLQRRLLLYLLICAPLVWTVGMLVSVSRARHEVNELYDSEMIRLARQVQATLAWIPPGSAPVRGAPVLQGDIGAADVDDFAIAVWDAAGKMLVIDRDGDGTQLARKAHVSGFIDEQIGSDRWRVYYLPSPGGEWLVATGQKAYERDEVVYSLTLSQLLPWLVLLPLLLLAMTWAVRRALAPVRELSDELRGRAAEDLRPLSDDVAPYELKPLVGAMNGLFTRIGGTLARERRFTADAAHELRTPLAVLRAQWDVVRGSSDSASRAVAERKLSAGMDRMDRLVTQLLALAGVETRLGTQRAPATEVSWQGIVEQAVSDCLPTAERRRIEIECSWPPPRTHPFPLLGDAHLLTVLLRNLLDNAVRYAPSGSVARVIFGPESVTVENDGKPLGAEQLARLGERFYRPDGQQESGSGLGISIVQRIASLHGLTVSFGARDDSQGVRVVVGYPLPTSTPGATSP
jgi:two-component system sensor histidine kinase QseC